MKKIFLIYLCLISITLGQSSRNQAVYYYYLYSGGRAYSDNLITNPIDGTMELSAPIYASNFSASLDGFSGTNGTASYNVDGVSDGSASKDNCLSFWANATSGFHNINWQSPSVYSANKAYTFSFDFYLPSANTNVKNITFGNYAAGGEQRANSGNYSFVNGAWTKFRFSFVSIGSNPQIRNYERTSSSSTFVGANSSTDDLLYVTNITMNECFKWNRGTATGNSWVDTCSIKKRSGNYSMKLNFDAVGSSTASFIQLNSAFFSTLVSGIKYEIKFYVMSGTASTTLSYLVGDKTGTSSTLSTTGFEEVKFEFVATASTINQPLKLYSNKAATVYIDDLTLRSFSG